MIAWQLLRPFRAGLLLTSPDTRQGSLISRLLTGFRSRQWSSRKSTTISSSCSPDSVERKVSNLWAPLSRNFSKQCRNFCCWAATVALAVCWRDILKRHEIRWDSKSDFYCRLWKTWKPQEEKTWKQGHAIWASVCRCLECAWRLDLSAMWPFSANSWSQSSTLQLTLWGNLSTTPPVGNNEGTKNVSNHKVSRSLNRTKSLHNDLYLIY